MINEAIQEGEWLYRASIKVYVCAFEILAELLSVMRRSV
jgi:hypothetical protein